MPGAAPYGFMYFRGRLVVHPKEFEVLQMIVERHKKGEGTCAIARYLNSLKVRSKRGKTWEHSAIRKVIEHYSANAERIERALRAIDRDASKD